MSASGFLQDLAVVLSVAAAALWVFRRLGQPPVLGYLAAGILIGPHTPPRAWVADLHSLEALAEVGVVFLLFALGSEFNLSRLAKIGPRALFCAAAEAALLVGFGAAAGPLLGLPRDQSLLFGAVIALASTAIVSRTLLEAARRPSGWEELAAGILIAEDMIAVLLLALLSSGGSLRDAAGLGTVVLRFAMLVTVVLVTGLLVFPRVLRLAEHSRMDEVRSLLIVAICFGVAFLTERLGFSAALGAFLAGATASAGGHGARLHETVTPFRDVFGAVFFTSVGMLIDPGWLFRNWELALGLALAAVLARFLANLVSLCLAGEERASAVQASLAMLPVGEFSFILAQVAQRRGLGEAVYPLTVTFCLATTLASSLALPPALARPDRLKRLFPGPLGRLLDEYRAALKRLSVPARAAQVWRLVRPSLFQIALNAIGIAALFLGARFAGQRWGLLGAWPGALWALASFASLPFLLALTRKSQAAALILLEAASTRGPGDPPPAEARPLLTRLLMAATGGLVAWWFLALGWGLLPPWPYSAGPLAALALAAAVLWRRMNVLYARMQAALRESLSAADAGPEAAPAALAHFLGALAPDRVRVSLHRLGSVWAVGRSLRTLDLRAATGASVLQINRGGRALPSPDPDTVLSAGDELLLIGEERQLAAARRRLDAGPGGR